MHGFLNIHKPQGMTSFDVIRRLKPLLPRRHKIGHMGTLDPMATGVLPIAIGQASKLLYYIEDQSKEYATTMMLGAVSDTQDIWGKVQATGSTCFDMTDLKELVARYSGVIQQLPPMFSAVHHQGQRLHELARQGITVDREPREVLIESLEIIEIEPDLPYPRVRLAVACSRGTYVRTLCHDIGEALGTGAVMSELVRTRSGPFQLRQSVTLEEISQEENRLEAFLLPLDYPLQDLPRVEFSAALEQAFRHGQRIQWDSQINPGHVRVYNQNEQLLGMANAEEADSAWEIRPLRLIT
ncbi:MAG TPA: tRNA pseudouridine(55) synthase TruB [Syntrophomonadaceae bacterium]|nr:tRNA pseudouridine(55) synthase TruB [Syntrophomonadaceae bacterium]